MGAPKNTDTANLTRILEAKKLRFYNQMNSTVESNIRVLPFNDNYLESKLHENYFAYELKYAFLRFNSTAIIRKKFTLSKVQIM